MSLQKIATSLVILGLTFSGCVMAADDPGEDDKNFPGAFCQPKSNTVAITRDDQGRMLNNSNIQQTWICPIVRDVFQRNTVEYAKIVVLDNNIAEGDPNVSCKLVAKKETGATCNTSRPQHSKDTGTQKLEFAKGDGNFGTCEVAYYYFLCDIPGIYRSKKSGIVSYGVAENIEKK